MPKIGGGAKRVSAVQVGADTVGLQLSKLNKTLEMVNQPGRIFAFRGALATYPWGITTL